MVELIKDLLALTITRMAIGLTCAPALLLFLTSESEGLW